MGYEAGTSSRRSAAARYHVIVNDKDQDIAWEDGQGETIDSEGEITRRADPIAQHACLQL
jgi:hypothetical protein